MKKSIFLISIVCITLLATTGCDRATYPKETLAKSVKDLCNSEYNLDVDVILSGNTLAVYLPVMNLFDLTLRLSEKAQDKVQDVLLCASRVVLSTDADVRFYCIIAQDMNIPEIQLVIIKYVDDVKRAYLHDISRGEYFKRTLIDMNENPQAKKEQAIAKVFDKMKLDEDWQDKVMEDFFRSPPSSLEGIGYWQDKFYIKNITLEEFLAQQIASRVIARFREEEDLRKYELKSVIGRFVKEGKLKFFLISFKTESLLFVLDPKERLSKEKEILQNIFEVMSDVLYGYKFENFNFAEIQDETFKENLLVSRNNIYLFKKGKIGIDSILLTVN